MLFYCENHDNFSIPAANVRFKDHYFEAQTAGQIAHLQMPHIKRRGVRPATEEETTAWYGKDVTEPASIEAPAETIEVAEPAPAAAPEETVPVQEDEEPVPEVPEGSAADVLTWVGDDVDRAKAAAAAEVDGKQRKTLLADLDRIIGE